MRDHHVLSHRKSTFALTLGLTLLAGLSAPFTPVAEVQAATLPPMLAIASASTAPVPSSAVELSPTPPNDTSGVAPNIVVTFDDSGSMRSNFMGDDRPFDNENWDSEWLCAGVIDPRVTDSSDIRSRSMNGVYYNPNVIYSPPVGADGISFNQADATLTKVPVDGIAVNRPHNTKVLGAAGFNNNPSGTDDSTDATDLTGTTKTLVPKTGWYWDSTQGGTYTTWSNWVYGIYPTGSGRWSSNGKNDRPNKSSETQDKAYPSTDLGDKRWKCGSGKSPMNGTTAGPDGNSYPDGGPYYYRYNGPTIAVDADGTPTSAGRTTLYTSANWEAVAVLNTTVTIDSVQVNQWQNFANWYAYYRTRFLMTKTSVSRVFGALGATTPEGAFGSTIRVAWQNLNDGSYKLPPSTIISSLMDANSPACVASSVEPKDVQQPGTAPTAKPNCYRTAFFNWIFEIYGTSTTPNRASTIRAGEFFTQGKGNLGSTGNLRDPYWEPGKPITKDGQELVCRQNFHMLVTDGYWNEGNPTNKPTGFFDVQGTPTLGDALTTFAHVAASEIFWNVPASPTGSCADGGGTNCYPSLADIAFFYWAKDLRSDLANTVPKYMPDSTTGVTTAGSTEADKASEQYWNPANDPATWQHLVQYMVTLGVPGTLLYPNELTNLRTGATAWPLPARNAPQAIDDTWHAAVNSRGAYFNAANPKNLVEQLTEILTNITARSAPATTGAVNTSVLVPGALGFNTGYSSADWTGSMQAVGVNADGTTTTGTLWDAGKNLDDKTITDPTTRKIFTAKESAAGSFDGGAAFKTFAVLDAAGQALLSNAPVSVDNDIDAGQTRVDYLRGDRTKEGTTFRTRTHLLGAIIGSQPVYVSYPSSGYRNSWPAGSPEQDAIDNDASTCDTTSTCSSYEYFVKNNLTRTKTVYVGANDGMLHAFDASEYNDTSVTPNVVKPTANAGKELFAYVPRSTYANLGNLTSKDNFKFRPTVDGIPVTRDVFFGAATTTPVSTSAGWHTILVGGLRLGGRGVYALDVTDPSAMSASKVLWEFNADQADQTAWTDGSVTNPGGKPSDLGYTFGQPNIGRLNSGKWVVLVPGGYFPDCSKPPFTAANCSYPAAASNKFSSLFVLDAQTGKLIRELTTPDPATDSTAVASHGLSSPVLGDYNDDQIDDVAFAGDLDGNLWRYDLKSSDPNAWTVSLAYQPTTAGDQPITSMPRLFADPVTNKFIVVFGTGKYLGVSDNTSGSAEVQAVYGIRDTNTGSPVVIGDLVQQTLSEKLATDGTTLARGLTNYQVPSDKGGWYFTLGPSASSVGERVVVTPGALFDTGRVVIQTLIPGTNDPCSASIQGAIMVVNAGTGGSNGGLTGPKVTGWGGTAATATSTVGGRVDNPRTTGTVPLVSTIGGGTVMIPGLGLTGGSGVLNINDAIWRRRAWRELNHDQ
ncbi:MAG: PilC/PilY family type IV pilus protein [Rhodanobacter sp.]